MKQKNTNWKVKLLVLVLLSSIFLIQSSGNSKAWNRFQKDSWHTGLQLDFYSDFESGYNESATGSYGSDEYYGLLMMEIHGTAGYVNESVAFVWQEDSNNIRAYEYQNTNVLDLLDTYSAGYLKGGWYGRDYQSGDEYWDTFGIFIYEDEGNETFFKHIVWNMTGEEFFLAWNYSLGNFSGASTGLKGTGTTCQNYDGNFKCIVYTDRLNRGGGYGNFWEFNIDTHEVKEFQFNWTNQGDVRNQQPLIEDFDEDGDTEFLFIGEQTGGSACYLFSFDLTNWRLDGGDSSWCNSHNCFGVLSSLGRSIQTAGQCGGANANMQPPMLIETGTFCSRSFIDCITPPFTCYDCVPDGREIVTGYGAGASPKVKLFDPDGYMRYETAVGGGSDIFACGITQVDCTGDNIQDILYVSSHTSGTHQMFCVNGQTGTLTSSRQSFGATTFDSCKNMGVLIAELDGDLTTTEIVTSSSVLSVSDNDWTTQFEMTWNRNWSADYNFDNFMMGDFDGDTQIDFVGSSDTDGIVLLSTIEPNDNPFFIGNGVDVDTCTPICLNETITFFAREGLDYEDDEGDSAYLGVDCYGLGLSNITWGSNSFNPEVTCTYTELGSWEVTIYITDFANFPSFAESQTFGIYTSLGSSCYSAGEWEEDCSPDVLIGIEPTDNCFTDSGLSVCLVTGTSPFLCDSCNCSDVGSSRCAFNFTGGEYQALMFDWSLCEDWEGSFWYPACPIYVWAYSGLNAIWNWIFTVFWIFLALIIVILLLAILFKKKMGK